MPRHNQISLQDDAIKLTSTIGNGIDFVHPANIELNG